MFKGKNFDRGLFFLAVIVCRVVLGSVVRQAGSPKPEVGRSGQTGSGLSQLVMPSGVEASQKKGVHRTNGFVRLVSLAHDDARRRLQEVYTSQIGVREETGKNDGPEVEKYLLYTGLGRGNAWCAAFVSWVYGQAGMDRPKTAWSPALFPAKRVVWERNQQESIGAMQGLITYNLQRTTPLSGDVFGIYFQELKRIAHCGFVDQWDNTWCITVEGNTNDMGSVYSENNRDNPIRAGPGEGVYRKKRLVKTIYKVADWVSPLTN